MLDKKAYRREYYLKNRDKAKAQSRAWQMENREAVRKRAARYRERNREKRRQYSRDYIRKRRAADPEYGKKYYSDNIKHYKALHKANSRAVKIEVMGNYGGKCACCGESAVEFLCLDHIRDDGKQHRKELKGNGLGAPFYRYLKRNGFPYKDRLQVLCMNCNAAKRLGVCPHRRKEAQDAGPI